MAEIRVGIGYDAHALEDGVVLVLGGVELDHPQGLAGHSDGDVLAHALVDAVLGAAGLGDIGTLFPSMDDRFRGISSLVLLKEAYAQVRDAALPGVAATAVAAGADADQGVAIGAGAWLAHETGVAVDAVFDSVSVTTTFKEKLSEMGIIFCSMSDAVQEHPELIKKYLGSG